MRLAVSRADASIELWSGEARAGRSARMSWYQELVIPGTEGESVETLTWCGGRLYSAGLNGQIVEWNLLTLVPKVRTSVYLDKCLSACLPASLPVCLPACLSVCFLFVCFLFVCLFACFSLLIK